MILWLSELSSIRGCEKRKRNFAKRKSGHAARIELWWFKYLASCDSGFKLGPRPVELCWFKIVGESRLTIKKWIMNHDSFLWFFECDCEALPEIGLPIRLYLNLFPVYQLQKREPDRFQRLRGGLKMCASSVPPLAIRERCSICFCSNLQYTAKRQPGEARRSIQ